MTIIYESLQNIYLAFVNLSNTIPQYIGKNMRQHLGSRNTVVVLRPMIEYLTEENITTCCPKDDSTHSAG